MSDAPVLGAPMAYAGADWLARSLKRDLAPFEILVADILGATFLGIYHIDEAVLRKTAEWRNDHVRVKLDRSLATYDGAELAALVILCHDAAVRLEIRARMNYLVLFFTPRTRDGSIWDWHSSIEAAAAAWRGVVDLRPEEERKA